jgi:hypothetical protein
MTASQSLYALYVGTEGVKMPRRKACGGEGESSFWEMRMLRAGQSSAGSGQCHCMLQMSRTCVGRRSAQAFTDAKSVVVVEISVDPQRRVRLQKPSRPFA